MFTTLLLLGAPALAIEDIWDDVPEVSDEPAAGLAYVSDDTFTVLSKVTVDYVYVVGEGGLSAGDRIRIEDPVFHGMTWARKSNLLAAQDFGQGTNPPACTELELGEEQSYGLVALAEEPAGATLSLDRVFGVDDRAHLHAYAYTEVVVEAGDLSPGEEIVVRYGDTSEDPNCGHQTLDRAFRDISWQAYEQVGAGDWAAVTPAPVLQFISQPDPTTLHVAAPSIVGAGEPIRLKVALLDSLGNPVATDGDVVTVSSDYGGATWTTAEGDDGWHDFEIAITDAGVHRIEVTGAGLTGASNPIEVVSAPPGLKLYWGDVHTHHGHTYYDDGGARIDENHVYGRDVLGYDFGAESMKGDDLPDGSSHFEINEYALWEELRDNCTQYTDPGSYISLFGWEWMGEVATNYQDGHHNLYFDSCDGPLGGHSIQGLGAQGGLFQWVEALEAAQGVRTVVIPHATPYTGYNWRDRNDDVRSTAEIYSTWGHSLDLEDPEGPNAQMGVRTALSMGHRMGFIGASDNHQGWLGNPFAEKERADGSVNASGLAAFWADELTYEALFEALKGRQTYATTGDRILLRLEADVDAGLALPGEEVDAAAPTFRWGVYGTAPIQTLTLTAIEVDASLTDESQVSADRRAGEVIYTESPSGLDAEGEFTWGGIGGETYAVWMTVTQTDGEVAWSSPFWMTGEGGGDTDEPGDDTGGDDSGDDTGGDTDTALADSGDAGDGETPGSRCAGCFGGGTGGAALVVFAGLGALRRRE